MSLNHSIKTAPALVLALAAIAPAAASAKFDLNPPQTTAVSRPDPRSPDARDAALAAARLAPTRGPVVVSVSESGGFDWGDAAIGAGGAAGLLLVAGGTAAYATRRRHAQATGVATGVGPR